MRAGLPFNYGFTAKFIAAGLNLLCLINFTAGAQSKGFSAAVSGGYSKIYNNGDNFPFTEADNGYFIQLSGMLPLGRNWGGIINLQYNFLPLNTGKAADRFLNNDPNAVSIQVKSGQFTMANNSIGIYYDVNTSKNFFIRIAPLIGYSYLRTPAIDVLVDTEPTTSYKYEKGGSLAFSYGLNIRPAFRISKQASIHLTAGYSYAAFNITSEFNDVKTSNKVNYGKLNLGAGLEYSFSGGKGQ